MEWNAWIGFLDDSEEEVMFVFYCLRHSLFIMQGSFCNGMQDAQRSVLTHFPLSLARAFDRDRSTQLVWIES
jgi:hypothetical protein